MVRVWLAMDPETFRITMQDREFSVDDFPRGLRGLDWPVREGQIAEEVWRGILAGTILGADVDLIHRGLWTQIGPTAWPSP